MTVDEHAVMTILALMPNLTTADAKRVAELNADRLATHARVAELEAAIRAHLEVDYYVDSGRLLQEDGRGSSDEARVLHALVAPSAGTPGVGGGDHHKTPSTSEKDPKNIGKQMETSKSEDHPRTSEAEPGIVCTCFLVAAWEDPCPRHGTIPGTVAHREAQRPNDAEPSKWPCFFCGSNQAHFAARTGRGLSTVPACEAHKGQHPMPGRDARTPEAKICSHSGAINTPHYSYEWCPNCGAIRSCAQTMGEWERPVEQRTDHPRSALWIVRRRTTASFLGAYDWVRTEEAAAHFVSRETADEAARVAASSNAGVEVIHVGGCSETARPDDEQRIARLRFALMQIQDGIGVAASHVVAREALKKDDAHEKAEER